LRNCSRDFANAKIQEGDQPAETPLELIAELERTASELGDLIKGINKTNSATAFDGSRTISDALGDRDVLALRRAAYGEVGWVRGNCIGCRLSTRHGDSPWKNEENHWE